MKIAIVHGGTSTERLMSTKNAERVLGSLKKNGYDACLVDYDRNISQKLIEGEFDYVFAAVQGKGHGDGTLQSICEHLGLKYSGTQAGYAAIINDKFLCKELCRLNEIKTPPYLHMKKAEFSSISKAEFLKKLEEKTSLPVVAKVCSEGGSYGISLIKSDSDYEKISPLYEYDDEVLFEQYVEGKFITQGVLEKDGELLLLPPITAHCVEKGELELFNRPFICEEAELSEAVSDEIHKATRKISDIFSVKDYARIDYILCGDVLYFIEINAVPGLREESFYPFAAKLAGIEFDEIMKTIIENS